MPVAFAARLKRLTAFAFLVFGLKSQSKRISGPAMGAETPLNFGGNLPPINIKARALRLHNRNANQSSIYERKHVILAEGLRK